MAYEIIFRASRILDVLKSEIGASARCKEDEDDFLRGVRTHLRGILRSATAYLGYWNYVDHSSIEALRLELSELLEYVELTLETPLDQRGESEIW